MAFPPNWYDYKVSYAHPFGSTAAVLLTCAFLYASLAKNERISKGRYVLCGGIALIFPVLAALYFSNETAYLCFGILVILFLLSILEYGYCSRRNEEQPCSRWRCCWLLHSLRRHGCRHSCHILQRHLGLQIDRFFPERAVFLSVDGTGHSAPVRVPFCRGEASNGRTMQRFSCRRWRLPRPSAESCSASKAGIEAC